MEDEDDEPLGLVLDEADPPVVPPVLLEDVPPVVDGEEPLIPLEPGPVLLEDEEPGELGAVEVVDEEDEPPGTTIVSFSFVVVLVDELGGGDALLPGGTTVVVSFFSQADKDNAAKSTNR